MSKQKHKTKAIPLSTHLHPLSVPFPLSISMSIHPPLLLKENEETKHKNQEKDVFHSKERIFSFLRLTWICPSSDQEFLPNHSFIAKS